MKIELTPTLWRYLLPLFIVSALSSVVSAQTSDTVIPLSSTVVDLPMRFRGPEPAIEVMVNGQGPFLFAIDTGATDQARIDSSLLERLGLRVSGSDRVGDGSGGTGLKVRTVHGHPAVDIAIGSRRVTAEIDSGNVVAGFLFPEALVMKLPLATRPVDAGRPERSLISSTSRRRSYKRPSALVSSSLPNPKSRSPRRFPSPISAAEYWISLLSRLTRNAIASVSSDTTSTKGTES